MKLYTTTSYPPAVGGAQLHTHQLVRRLADRGHAVQVVTHWAKNRTDWLWGTTLTAPAKPHTYAIDGVPVHRLHLTRAERWRGLPAVLGYYPLKPWSIHHLAASLRPKIDPFARHASLIHNVRIGREPLSVASWQVARQLDIPFVLVPYHHPRWVGWRYREYIQLYRRADALLALTAAEKETLIRLGVRAERVHIIGNGPNLAAEADPAAFRQALGLPAEAPVILFLGQKYRYKGLEPLTAAAPLVWASHPEAYFVCLGPRTRFSRRLFARLSDPRFIEQGRVDLQHKTNALAACTLLCLPSTQESFGGVYTEAWTFGKPVIGAPIPAVAEVIDEGVNGYLVSPTPPALAERITYLLDNPALAARLGQAGQQKTAQQYHWDKLAQRLENIYTQILG